MNELTAEGRAVLIEGVGLILWRWTAMRAAVENGWGGRDSQAKADGTVSTVFKFLIQSQDPARDIETLGDILDKGLDELNTTAEDGSVDEVANTLIDLYEDCCNHNYEMLEELRATRSQATASVVKVSNGNDEESDDEDEDNDQTTDMMVEASNQKPEVMPVDEPAADDGWTVVSSRKNKGKRN
ncbi:Pre-rRNA-processing protein TSR2 [Arabidopsis suecica]|uniref:Pre-rRNA-processing protein TSR2 n=1 Tax=Arabidopsis suecica TaxID=45249 RepID=A0A8T1ZD79_ARASU|nr:Pre-rRNA-processing protein TSR2 [Arabidopsis suecica]